MMMMGGVGAAFYFCRRVLEIGVGLSSVAVEGGGDGGIDGSVMSIERNRGQ